MDVYRRFYQLGLLASAGVAIDGIGEAQPPTGRRSSPRPGARPRNEMIAALKEQLPLGGIGSNGVGLGKDATDNGRGMMLGNPHFPWDGTERFYQAQLTIPGSFNVEGGSLFGVPLVLIGHNDSLAWSHTVSTAYRFTPFEEKLGARLADHVPPGRRSSKQMRADTVTVQAKRGRRHARATARARCTRPTTGRSSTRCWVRTCSRGRRSTRTRWATPTRPTSAT